MELTEAMFAHGKAPIHKKEKTANHQYAFEWKGGLSGSMVC